MHKRSAVNALIANAFARLLLHEEVGGTREEQLVIAALRRSSRRLEQATVDELGEYLSTLSGAELRGVASNIKGIYHELAFVDTNNSSSHDGETAQLFDVTNHPGADVRVTSGDGSTRDIQLKAVGDSSSIATHQARYPDVPVMATSEVAESSGVVSSGFSNVQLRNEVEQCFDAIEGPAEWESATLAAGGGALLSAIGQANAILNGRVTLQNVALDSAKTAMVAGTSSAFVDLLFG